MVNPKEKTPILDCVRTLFEALEELDDFETLALRNCNKNHAPGLLHLVGHSWKLSKLKRLKLDNYENHFFFF